MMTRSMMRAPDDPGQYMDVSFDDLPAGNTMIFDWNNARYALVRTTDEMLEDLKAQTRHTWSQRPIPADRPVVFVYSLSTSVPGCVAQHAPHPVPRYAPEREWQGGFYDPCHYAEWDYAGRAIKQYPDQPESMRVADLEVPRFELRGRNTLRLRR